MTTLHAAIEAHAERAKAEINLLSSILLKKLMRKIEFTNRSLGQRRRYYNAK